MPEDINSLLNKVIKECKISEFAHKDTFSRKQKLAKRFGISSAFFASITSLVGTLKILFQDSISQFFSSLPSYLIFINADIIVVVLTWFVTVITILNSYLKPSETSKAHLERAMKFEALKWQAQQILALGHSEEMKQDRSQKISSEIADMKKSGPIITNKQRNKAIEHFRREEINDPAE